MKPPDTGKARLLPDGKPVDPDTAGKLRGIAYDNSKQQRVEIHWADKAISDRRRMPPWDVLCKDGGNPYDYQCEQKN